MEEKVIKRGYVKWTDEGGVFHKEPLVDHPELLAKASPADQLQAEEVKRLNAAAEDFYKDREGQSDEDVKNTLEALKAAPDEVVTASQLTVTNDEEGNQKIVVAEPVTSETLKAPEPVEPAHADDNDGHTADTK